MKRDENVANQEANCLGNKEGRVNKYKQVRAASRIFSKVFSFFSVKISPKATISGLEDKIVDRWDRIHTRGIVENHTQIYLRVGSTTDEKNL